MDFWDDVSKAQIRKSAVVHRAGACSQAPDEIQCDLFLNGMVVRLVVTDSLASAAGRASEIRPGRLDLDWTAARLVVTDSLAGAAGRDAVRWLKSLKALV
jgi:hypothetical protein